MHTWFTSSRSVLRVRRQALMVVLAAVTCSRASADTSLRVISPKGSIYGQSEKLAELSKAVLQLDCPEVECHLTTPATWFTVSAPGQHSMRLRLTRVAFPRNVRRYSGLSSDDDTQTRPILVRARANIRHAGDEGQTIRDVPIAGTIFRDERKAVLEFAIPHVSRGGRVKNASRNIVIRSVLNQVHSTSAVSASDNARAKLLPTTVVEGRTCSLQDGHSPFARGVVEPLQGAPSTSSSGSPRQTAPATFQVFYIATDYDSQYGSRVGCTSASVCKNQILSVVNQAAVYYEAQLGATLNVPRQYGPTAVSSTTDSEALLAAFADYNLTNRASVMHTGRNTAADQVDLFQLFTGKDLNANVIGLAYLGYMCRNSQPDAAALLVQYVADSVNQVIVAHETGHTLGANHTDDGTGIMAASLSNPAPSSFSEQSISEITTHINRYYGECRGGSKTTTPPTATPQPSSTATTTPVPGATATPVNSPVPGATATPTPRSGGAGGSPGAGGNDPSLVPMTLGLQVSQSRKGLVTVRATTTSSQLCTITVRAASSVEGALTGRLLSQFEAVSDTSTLTGGVALRVRTKNNKPVYAYFYAQHSCGDGTVLERSMVRKINPNRITVKRARTTSIGSWIAALGRALRI